jgi:protein TonB
MMNRQLSTPSRIPSDLKMLAGKEPPPSSGFASSGLEGVGGSGAAGNVFSGSNGPKVKIAAPSKMSISAGVAGGLLLQKTSPAYPQMAKEARVSGTVVIQATISKTGAIENPHVVSGPTMLRQAALDAVKTWRYKPYLLDGEPVDVETTVSVNFSLGG